ncbi:hypothetical protein CSPX01_04573 [Colletotrichum filicis]|nr:hypothetical protein CSPX01_04573 [Colletotrichum filicis]
MQSATCNPPLRRPSLEEHRSVFNHSQPSRFPTRRPSRNLSVVVLCRGSQEVHPSSPRTTIDEPNANVDGSQQGFSQLSNAFLPGYLSEWSSQRGLIALGGSLSLADNGKPQLVRIGSAFGPERWLVLRDGLMICFCNQQTLATHTFAVRLWTLNAKFEDCFMQLQSVGLFVDSFRLQIKAVRATSVAADYWVPEEFQDNHMKGHDTSTQNRIALVPDADHHFVGYCFAQANDQSPNMISGPLRLFS